MIHYETALLIAIFSFVYCVILTDPHQIFNKLYKRLDFAFNSDAEGNIRKEKHWIFKIIIGCEKCNAGQIALWLYLFTHLIHYYIDPFETLLLHLSFVTFTIFCVTIITHTYKKHIEHG